MINGLFSAASGMFNQQQRLDVTASNIANADVPGFKGEQVVFSSFPDILRVQQQRFDSEPIELGKLGGGAAFSEVTTNHAGGQVTATGVSEDIAIFGEGFFHLETPDGERLSRNGAFLRDSEGYLKNSDGNFVLGQKGRIQITEVDFKVNEAGEVFVQKEGATAAGQIASQLVKVDTLKLSRVDNIQDMERIGNSLYFLPSENGQEIDPGKTSIGQGYIERSNISAIEESVKMVDTYRIYQASQRMIQAIDDTLDTVINTVGKG